ncbi:hypothetical protein IW140_005748 [Coemansia sp. RSA 1813]|nr:hypothetical protein EV178_002186 [Coemansia sp. RSA 1646]KAJ1767236.1 hypothetical protein LPJ74_005478 [Coemansia sp. RSA 1843]KAJ2090314.1 hypothetical protein IW138_002740 [Coemansia sp. RSA 986]KAJ2215504.1 hypothetical protein EV179_002097 [Coemansia sp. RSA 487]KAJ2564410.1 hypothetical protein IW140_005748 [Coemansia sp. RSA 1813]
MPYPKDADSDTAHAQARTSSWPHRRNPLPANFLHTTPPRRRRTDNLSTPEMKPSLLAETDSSDSWDGDTITLHSFGTLSRTPSNTGSADEPIFSSAYDKQQKRTINELGRQLESRDDDVAVLTRQIEQLKKQTEEARRQMQAERQESKKYELRIRWHEDQLRQQQAKIDSMGTSHRLALSLAQRKHDSLVERLAAKIVHAENEVKRLKQRVGEMTKELDGARIREEETSQLNAELVRQLSDARRAACQASSAAAMLVERLDERAAFIGALEERMLRLPPLPPGDCVSLSDSGSAPDAPGHACDPQSSSPVAALGSGSPAISGKCLFAEITKATLMQHGGNNGSASLADDALPAPPLFPPSDAAVQKRPKAEEEAAIQPGSSAAAAGSEGILYWLAVYVHMLWSFYYKVCISPMLFLAGIVVRAAFLFVTPVPLVRVLAMLLPSFGRPAVRK